MDYLYMNGVQVVKVAQKDDKNPFIEQIVDTTANTWQQGRKKEEKTIDTKQGKTAEDVVETYSKEYNEFVFVSYDEIREDNFRKHAPFDALLYKKSKTTPQQYENCKTMILKDVEKSTTGKISKETRKYLRNNMIYTVEIKSTSAANRKRSLSEEQKKKALSIIQQIKKDDFFLYPHYCRESNEIKTLNQYLQYIKKEGLFADLEITDFISVVFDEEIQNASDIQIRVYIDDESNACYIVGYSLAKDILEKPNIKKFNSKKSKDAVYFTKPLIEGKSVNLLFSDSRLWDETLSICLELKETYQLREVYKKNK